MTPLRSPMASEVRGVGDQVHHHLPDLGHVAFDPGQIADEVELQHRFLGDHRLEQVADLLHHGGQHERLDQEAAPARVGQHLVGQLGGALGRLLDPIQMGRQRRLGWGLHHRQAHMAQDPHQQVVEVVGDTPGQHAQALQLLGVVDPGFQIAAFPLGSLALGHLLLQPLVRQLQLGGTFFLPERQLVARLLQRLFGALERGISLWAPSIRIGRPSLSRMATPRQRTHTVEPSACV
jgi:hypothetical protein